MHLLRLGDEFLPELGMRNADDALGPFPSGLTLDIELSILRHQIVEVRPGGGDNRPLQQRGPNAGFHLSALIHIGRGTADKALDRKSVV